MPVALPPDIKEILGTEYLARLDAPQPTKYRFLRMSELRDLEPPEWLIPEIIPEKSVGLLYGPQESYKSFLVVHWVMSLGLSGRRCVYVSAEGQFSLGKRMAAWELTNQRLVDDSVVLGVPHPINLMEDVSDFVKEVKNNLPVSGGIDLLVFDTLAKCAVGGEENSARDMGRVLDAAYSLSGALGCSVLIIHHTTKDGSAYRGSSALLGGVDWAAELKRSGNKTTLTCTKQKDAEHFNEREFELVPVAEAHSACIRELEPLSVAQTAGKNMELLYIMSIITENEPRTAKVITTVAEKEGISESSVYRGLKALIADGSVEKQGVGYRITPKGSTKALLS